MTLRLALSVGEPAGIGPDLAVLAAQRPREYELHVFADPELLLERAKQLGLPLELHGISDKEHASPGAPGTLTVVPVPLVATVVPGRPDPANAPAVLAALDAAYRATASRECTALVTGPIHKGVVNEAGFGFTGHTEYLARAAGGVRPVMLLVADTLRVALATTHLALAQVPTAVTTERLTAVIEVLARGLASDFGISCPRILVLGLNPHAGEGGHLGREEMETIAPALAALHDRGFDLAGPVPADTAFVPQSLAEADAILAMYHDQALPVLKYAGFGHAVNVTLGLPIVRTSVDHGTALDLAATGQADPGSLESALALAVEISTRRSHG